MTASFSYHLIYSSLLCFFLLNWKLDLKSWFDKGSTFLARRLYGDAVKLVLSIFHIFLTTYCPSSALLPQDGVLQMLHTSSTCLPVQTTAINQGGLKPPPASSLVALGLSEATPLRRRIKETPYFPWHDTVGMSSWSQWESSSERGEGSGYDRGFQPWLDIRITGGNVKKSPCSGSTQTNDIRISGCRVQTSVCFKALQVDLMSCQCLESLG